MELLHVHPAASLVRCSDHAQLRRGGEKSKPDDAADADLSLTLIALDSHHCQTRHRRTARLAWLRNAPLPPQFANLAAPINMRLSASIHSLPDSVSDSDSVSGPGHGQSLCLDSPPVRDCLTGWLVGCLAASCLIWTPFCSVIWLNGGNVVVICVDFAQLHRVYN